MAGCRFGSNELVTSLSGVVATPTFAFSAANANYFGLPGSFTSANGATCSFPTRSVGAGQTSTYVMTPIIVTTSGGVGRTTTCNFLKPPSIIPTSAASTTYSGIECPSITDNQFAPGTYTLRFNQPNVNGVPSITSRVFVIAAPTTITDFVTATIAQTVTQTGAPTSTTTITEYISTVTETPAPGQPQTVIETVTAAVGTLTVTDFVQSCETPSPTVGTPSTSSPASAPSSTSSPASTPSTSSTDSTPSTSSPASTPSTSSPDSTPSSTSSPDSTPSSTSSPDSTPSSTSPASAPSSTSTPDSTPSSTSSPASTPSATSPVSLNGECGGAAGQTCLGSAFGNCCSLYGYCGSTDIYCQPSEGCQSGFGTCNTPSPVSSGALPTSTVKISTDGTCGGANGAVCPGSVFGDCCSAYGYCGTSTAHCGAGCQLAFGTCAGSPVTTGTAPPPASTLKVSLDGTCGGTTGQTCQGSDFGSCCSEYGYCGSTSIYCSTGCQPAFGTCSGGSKRSIINPKLQPARFVAERNVQKRVIGGAGPDYTYPPIPHTTVTNGVTQVATVTAAGGILTTTVSQISTTRLATASGSVVTITQAAGATSTETVRVTNTVCSTVI